MYSSWASEAARELMLPKKELASCPDWQGPDCKFLGCVKGLPLASFGSVLFELYAV